ncbi:hypothetical protein mvi_18570 [Methylobacterium indicum]|uniref:Uncharacterized protein n=1 Tax=Methylobacterium indicum TaxID=1775910 RepID=A0A8H8WS52_9HYPH|nr:hypothetical protein mvi_18570 [Methylobacterium indicum]
MWYCGSVSSSGAVATIGTASLLGSSLRDTGRGVTGIWARSRDSGRGARTAAGAEPAAIRGSDPTLERKWAIVRRAPGGSCDRAGSDFGQVRRKQKARPPHGDRAFRSITG